MAAPDPSPSTRPPRRLQTLDGLRGVAALAVMAHHMPLFFGGHFPEAYLSVDFFFALSGVVIALAYRSRLEAGLSPAAFFRLRSIRLYPLYLAGLLLGALAALAAVKLGGSPMGLEKFLRSGAFALFMLPSFLSFSLYPINGPAWSLAYELLVNLAYALWLRKLGRAWLAGLCAVAGLSLIPFAFLRARGIDAGYDWGWDQGAIALGRVLYSFVLGVLILGLDPARLPRLRPWIIAGILILILSAEPTGLLRPCFDLAAVWALLPGLVCLGLGNEPQSAWGARLCALLGEASYGIYVIHYPVIALVGALLWACKVPAGPGLGVLTMLATLGLAAWLSRAYDGPLRKKLTEIFA